MDIKTLTRSRRGQNTVEYLLMLTVVVGVVLVSGAMLKKFMPTMFDDIAQKILHAADGLGQGQG
jgi:Flp pilus assembly pilin Flp